MARSRSHGAWDIHVLNPFLFSARISIHLAKDKTTKVIKKRAKPSANSEE
jgi:hypothetical protein